LAAGGRIQICLTGVPGPRPLPSVLRLGFGTRIRVS
jgi:hypothetical protein